MTLVPFAGAATCWKFFHMYGKDLFYWQKQSGLTTVTSDEPTTGEWMTGWNGNWKMLLCFDLSQCTMLSIAEMFKLI